MRKIRSAIAPLVSSLNLVLRGTGTLRLIPPMWRIKKDRTQQIIFSEIPNIDKNHFDRDIVRRNQADTPRELCV